MLPQILGYLSDLGLMYGTLSTYTVTWLVKTDGRVLCGFRTPFPMTEWAVLPVPPSPRCVFVSSL